MFPADLDRAMINGEELAVGHFLRPGVANFSSPIMVADYMTRSRSVTYDRSMDEDPFPPRPGPIPKPEPPPRPEPFPKPEGRGGTISAVGV